MDDSTITRNSSRMLRRRAEPETRSRTPSPPARRLLPARTQSSIVGELRRFIAQTDKTATKPSSKLRQQQRTRRHSIASLVSLLKSVKSKDPNITRISLEGRPLPAAYLTALLAAAAEHPHLQHLRLCRVVQDEAVWQAVALCIQESPSLETVDVSKNSGFCPTILADALRHTKSPLRRLDVSGNHFSDIRTLVRALPRTCTTLKMGRNAAVTEAAWVKLAEELPVTPHLLSLDARATKNWGPNAVAALCRALAMPQCRLRALYLNRNHNDWNSEAVRQLARALHSNKHLRLLDLQRCWHVDDRAAAALTEMLEVNHTFCHLKLRRTLVGDAAKEVLLEWLLWNAHGPALARQTKAAYKRMHSFTSVEQPPRSRLVECAICYDIHDTCAVLMPCLHYNVCANCAPRLQKCHMCRRVVVKALPVPATEANAIQFCVPTSNHRN